MNSSHRDMCAQVGYDQHSFSYRDLEGVKVNTVSLFLAWLLAWQTCCDCSCTSFTNTMLLQVHRGLREAYGEAYQEVLLLYCFNVLCGAHSISGFYSMLVVC